MRRTARHSILKLEAAALLLFAVGCGDSAEPPRATNIAINPASISLSWVGETMAMTATVTDQRGQPFEGTVSWSSSDASVFTVNAAGVVTAVANGNGTLRASIADVTADAMVTMQQVADSVEIESGSGQRAVPGSTLADSVVVRVLDEGGTAVAAATVNFVPNGGGSADPASAETNAAGRAATRWTLGPGAGAQSLAARVPDGPSAEASATALTPAEVADSIEVASGDHRRAVPGHTLPIEVRVLDEDGEPVQGVPVAFAPGEGHGTASPASVTTGEDGLAATRWTLGSGTGEQRLAASIEDGPTTSATAFVALPAAVWPVLIDPQGATGRPTTMPAQLVDADSVPLEGSLRFAPAQEHGTVDAGEGPAPNAVVRTDTLGTASVVWTPMGDVAAQPVQTLSVSAEGFPGVPALDIDLRIISGICSRTPEVVYDLMWKLSPDPDERKPCADVTLEDLDSSPHMGQFILVNSGITALKSWDFAGIDVTMMILAGNELEELPPGVFSGLPNLFDGLPNLSTLILTENRFTASVFAEIDHLSGLVIMDISRNPLTEIPEGAFDRLVNLELLGLLDTNLRGTPAGVFDNLSQLRVLSLAENDELRTLEKDMFRGLSALLELNLSRTSIETIEPGAFDGLGALQFLDIGNTPDLTTLSAGALRGMSGLVAFTLDSTAVSVIEPGAFSGLNALRFLQLDRTQLAGWTEGAFRGMSALEFLWLSDNPRLTTLRANAFADLPPSQVQLAVTNGVLDAIEPGAFNGLTNLYALLLDGNRLTSWPAGAFQGPSDLIAISLADNGISELPAGAFADQLKLSSISLADNAIAAWPTAALETLTNLTGLDMSGNDISALPGEVLGGLTSLSHLDLRGNPGAPFVLALQLDRVGSGALSEGDEARIRAKTATDLPAYFASELTWTASGDVIGLTTGSANWAAGEVATDPWTLSGDNNGAAGGAQVAVWATADFESDSIFGLALRFANTLVLEFAADSTRTNRRPVAADSIPSVTLDPDDDGVPDTAVVNLAAYFTDPDGDTLTYEILPARRLVEATVEGDSMTLASLLPGRTTVEVRAFDPGGFVAISELTVTVRGAFDMEVVYLGDISDEHKRVFEEAAERWEAIFIAGLEDVDFSEQVWSANDCAQGQPAIADTVSDVRIYASIRPIDGPRGILARAGPCALREDGFHPVLGVMEFDAADIPFLASQPTGLIGTILHEMAHVLGFGTIWDANYANLLRNPSAGGEGGDTHFVGPLAIAAFDAAGGSGYTGAKVPVDNTGIPGSADGHWRENVLVTELMTSNYDPGENPLSAITIQSMADIGYVVDVGIADDYTVPGPGARAFADRLCEAGQCIDLSGDIRQGPIVLVNSRGRITGVVRR